MSKEIEQSGGIAKDNQLFTKVSELIELARKKVAAAVNLTMVHTYFEEVFKIKDFHLYFVSC